MASKTKPKKTPAKPAKATTKKAKTARVSKPKNPRASKTAKAAREAATPLSAAVLKQVARLKGTPPAAGAVKPMKVKTVDGIRPLSPAIAAFAQVTWPRGVVFAVGRPERTLNLRGNTLTEHLAEGYRGPLYAIAYDSSQSYLAVRPEDTSSDPMVFEVSHEGGSDLGPGNRLSSVLAGVSPVSTAASGDVASGLRAAIRSLDAAAAVKLVKQGGTQATDAYDAGGFTPLHHAAMADLATVVTALLEAGADPNATLSARLKFGAKYCDSRWNNGREPMPGETPLMSALHANPGLSPHPNLPGVVRALLAAGADANRADSMGRTPLSIAENLGVDDEEVFAALLAGGANPNQWDVNGWSALAFALLKRTSRVKALLAAGANPNLVTPATINAVQGATAIHCAVVWGVADRLVVLLDAGGDPNVRAGDGSLPLAHAKPDSEAAKVLLARGGLKA